MKLFFIIEVKRVSIIFFAVVAILFSSFYSVAQRYSVTISVKVEPSNHIDDSIFVAGNFNEWNPGNPSFRLTKIDSNYRIIINGLKADVYEFKFTRGDWSKGEVKSDGSGVENRLLNINSDTIVEYRIAGWQDDFAQPQRKHTASKQVHLLDSAFYMPQLDRYRRIWIYLPEGYEAKKNKKRYPVIYMHDGQNVFDEYTSGYGEWGVDECLDTLISNGKRAAIVVGIDCGVKRFNEYNPYSFEKFGEGEGDKYVAFLVKTLKPYIDKHYRTQKEKENTFIAGSSMGGLISYYALLAYPKIFGNAGVFSPAYWTAPAIKAFTDSAAPAVDGKIFFYMGDLEGGTYVRDMKEVADSIGKKSSAIIYTVIDPAGRHNEQAWRKWFAEFYCWVMGDGFNSQVKTD